MRGLACLVLVSSASAEPLKLGDVLLRVVGQGPEAQAVDAQVPIARADLRNARMLPNPQLLLDGGRAEPIFNASLQLRLPIFGQRGARVAAAERGLEQIFNEAVAARWKLRHDARVAYYAVAKSDEQVAIAAEIEALTARMARLARERFEGGAGSRLDQKQAELVHLRALQDVADRRMLQRTARLELARQLNVPVDRLGELADALADAGTTPELATLLAEAKTRHPELRAAQSERVAALAREGAARADRRPLPIIQVGIELLNPSTCETNHFCVGPRGALAFDLPILNLNGGPIERAQAEAKLAGFKAAAAEARIVTGVRTAWEQLQAARQRVRFFDVEYLPGAVEAEGLAREAFSAGKGSLVSLIEAERAVVDARMGRSEALFALQAARADLEQASGVALPVP